MTTSDGTASETFDVPTGIWGVQELDPPAGWVFTSLTCSDEDDPSGGSVVVDDAAAIDLQPGETVTCTFTNTKLATITIEKTSDPAGGTGFGFTATPPFDGSATFTLDDGGSQPFGSLPPNETYDFAETGLPTADPAWELTDISCLGTDGAVVDLPNASVAVTPLPGEDITCTFSNTQLGRIIVEKQTDPDNDPQQFTFTGAAAGTIGDGQQIVATDLPAGSYTSTESVPDGWVLGDISCDDDDSSGDLDTATATFNVASGETVTCTFENWALSVIVVKKITDPSPDPTGTAFDFVTNAGPDFSLANGGMEVITDLDAGTYSVTEDTPPNWALTDATCDNGDTPDAIALDNGEVVTCTFTNTADPGSITIRKTTDPSPDPTSTSFQFSGDVVGSIGNGQQLTSGDLPPGTYSVTELVPTSWTLSSITCNDDDSSGDIGTPRRPSWWRRRGRHLHVHQHGRPRFHHDRKATDPSPDPTSTSFRFSGDVVGSIGNGQQLTSGDLPPGTYSVTELVPTSWTLCSIVCSDGDSSGDTATATATIVVAAGEDVTCTFTNVAGDVAMAVEKSASASIVSDQGEDVTFTFTVSNTGDVPFSIVSLKDDVFGALSGDADCQVGTVLQPDAVCDFQQTFLVKPSVTPDPDDPDQVIPDHVDTFEACSILASTPTVAAASPTGCATDIVRIAFSRTLVVPVTPAPTMTATPAATPRPHPRQQPPSSRRTCWHRRMSPTASVGMVVPGPCCAGSASRSWR